MVSSSLQQQQRNGGGTSATATSSSNAMYTNVALSPPSSNALLQQQQTPQSTTTSNTATTGTGQVLLRQRRMTTTASQQQQVYRNSKSIPELCTDGYQCLCMMPVYPNYTTEYLEYNYNPLLSLQQQQSSSSATATQQPPPSTSSLVRIRNRGEYYIDSFNDQPKSFSFGTNENNGIWCNSSDQAGTIMSALVWCLLLYSAATVTALTVTEGIPKIAGEIYAVLVCLSLAAHAKTSLTDPGSVPIHAIPIEKQRIIRDSHSMCGQCQTFKPPSSHHCRICNRCISKMDHHCPWMNNCVGAANMKHFILFLIYTWTCASYSLILFGWNYFFCADEDCTFHPVVVHLVRIMTCLAVGAFLFTSSMLMNVCYGIITGIGTIDRLKKKATNTMSQSDEEPIPLEDIFGIGPYYTWCLPIDPVFDEFDRVLGYTIPQRLDRERQLIDYMNHITATTATTPNNNNSNEFMQSPV